MMIVYYTQGEKTKLFAEALSEILGQPIYRLEPESLHRKSNFSFMIAALFLTISGKLHPIINMPASLPDEIYVCSPIWGGKLASPVKYFLENADLSEKTVHLVITAGVPTEKYQAEALNYLTNSVKCVPGKVYIFAGTRGQEKDIVKQHLEEVLYQL